MTATDAWVLGFSAVGAVAGVLSPVLFLWGWIDRPRLAWVVRAEDVPAPRGRNWEKLIIHVHGSAAAHFVSVHPAGSTVLVDPPPDGHYAMQLTSGSDPMEVVVEWPIDGAPAYLDIVWSNLRPQRQSGHRVRLDAHGVWEWRWRWGSLRRRGWRLQRTKGDWQPHEPPIVPAIPVERQTRTIVLIQETSSLGPAKPIPDSRDRDEER